MNRENKQCQNCKNQFTIEPEDFEFYKKIDVPPPTWCPECRLIRRLSWRNERSLYQRTCGLCGKKIISMYDPNRPWTVYCHDCWYSDKWDPMNFGKEYDFSRPFFVQYAELMETVPFLTLSNYNSVNSEYTNFVDQNKNCYLVFGSGLNENISYASKAIESKDSLDLLSVTKSELMYECVNCSDSYLLRYSKDSKSCTDSWFLESCRNCSNCFGCSNLISKSYCFFNQQYTKEEYCKKLEELNLAKRSSIARWKKEVYEKIHLPSLRRYANIIGSVGCTGDNINNSKNCKSGFDLFHDCEDSKFLFSALNTKDEYDGIGQYKNYFSYENVDSNEGDHNLSTITVYHSDNARYSFNCHNSSNLFGCIGLRKKSYCILNKQYSKEEYLELFPKIMEQMNGVPYIDTKGRAYAYGEFFPTAIAPSAYNETLTQEYFPLEEKEAVERGYVWRSLEKKNYAATRSSGTLPDTISHVADDILNEVISCAHKEECNEQCAGVFKFIPSELQFYRKMGLPLPQLCPNCRHYARLNQKNPLRLWHRTCQCAGMGSTNSMYQNTVQHPNHEGQCPNEFETSYAPDRPDIVYCEECYQAEVV